MTEIIDFLFRTPTYEQDMLFTLAWIGVFVVLFGIWTLSYLAYLTIKEKIRNKKKTEETK